MPPKKKSMKGRKVVKKRVDTSDADCVSVEEMPREQLELYIQRLHKELKQEREERCFFRIEGDKIKSFWEICIDQLQDCKVKIREKDYEIIQVGEKCVTELNKFKQKVKFLMSEHQKALTDLKAEDMVCLKMAEDGYQQEIQHLKIDNKHLQSKLLEQEFTFYRKMKELKIQHRKESGDISTSFLSKVRNMYSRFEKQLEAIRTDLAHRHDAELAELETWKESKISDLIKSHEKSLFEMKNYYDDIILVNLSNISCLKEELIKAQTQEKLMRKRLRNATAQHNELAEPLKRAMADAEALKEEVVNCEKQRTLLVNSKDHLAKNEKALESVKYENEVLCLQIDKLQEELDALRKGFLLVALDFQQKSSLKSVLMQSKLSALIGLLQQKDAQVVEVLAASRRSAGTMSAMEQKMEKILKAKDTVIQDLKYELSRALKSRDDLVQMYQSKLHEYGIQTQDLELVPLEVTVKGLLKQNEEPRNQ